MRGEKKNWSNESPSPHLRLTPGGAGDAASDEENRLLLPGLTLLLLLVALIPFAAAVIQRGLMLTSQPGLRRIALPLLPTST